MPQSFKIHLRWNLAGDLHLIVKYHCLLELDAFVLHSSWSAPSLWKIRRSWSFQILLFLSAYNLNLHLEVWTFGLLNTSSPMSFTQSHHIVLLLCSSSLYSTNCIRRLFPLFVSHDSGKCHSGKCRGPQFYLQDAPTCVMLLVCTIQWGSCSLFD